MIPVFLLLTALVVDVGNWYTHKRQLQNRADAGSVRGRRRVREELEGLRPDRRTPRSKRITAQEIADAARQYAGDPEAADYVDRHILPARSQNTEIANQANLDVAINSTDPNYDDDTDYTDGGVGRPRDPCYKHTPGTTISPAAGTGRTSG